MADEELDVGEQLEAAIPDDAEATDAVETEETEDELEFELPEHWSDQDREEFQAISDRQKALAFAERKFKEIDSGYQKKFRENADRTKTHDLVEELFSPYKSEFAQAGLDVHGGLRKLAAWHGAMRQDPVGSLINLANAYGADPKRLIQQLANQARIDLLDIDSSAAATPAVPSLDPVQKQLEQLRQEQQAYIRQQQEQQLQAKLDRLETATDSEGNKLYPHLDEYLGDMTKILQAGIASTLEDAYQKATALRPPSTSFVRSKSDAIKKAKRAAGSSVKSSAPSSKTGAKPGSLRDALSHAFDEVAGSA